MSCLSTELTRCATVFLMADCFFLCSHSLFLSLLSYYFFSFVVLWSFVYSQHHN
uniref:Uncharacterized protein n=1 Tax=Meloidogyne enterolobii TaxID=390850 RepID=A0A6V7TR99_MELEN|nr:unnamed protein product [Meloidogyne enterolobii]